MQDALLLDIQAAAALCGVAPTLVYRAVRRRKLPAAKKRPIITVRLSDLNEWNHKRTTNPNRGGRPRVIRPGVVQLLPEGV